MPNPNRGDHAKANANTHFAEWIRHNPGFGIASKIMRCESRNADYLCVLLNHLPDDLLA
jgi:hypothetical protein